MSQRKVNSRALRQLALGFLGKLSEEIDLFDVDHEDLATSLVRQWITYDGRAMLLFGEQVIHADLMRTPLGRMTVVAEQGISAWPKRLCEDWRISSDELREIFSQLNRGQSVEVVSQDEVPLRLWVNPKERSHGVDSIGDESAKPRPKRDYRKFALHALEQRFVNQLATDELEELAASLVKQWHQYEGHACLFLDGGEQLCFKLEEQSDGSCVVRAVSLPVHLEPLLHSFGFPPEALPEVIAQINLGQQIEFRDKDGIPSLLYHDPKARRIAIRKTKPSQ